MTRVTVHITVYYRTGRGPEPLKFVADHNRTHHGETIPYGPGDPLEPWPLTYKCDGKWLEIRHRGGLELFPTPRVVRVEVREEPAA